MHMSRTGARPPRPSHFQRYSISFILSALACWLSPAAADVPLHALHDITLQSQMAHHLQTEELNGAVWSLVTPDAGVLTGAAGVRDAATGQPMTPETRVHIGSVAKTVLAVGVLRLITTGKLTLDTEVAPLVPAARFDNPWQATDPIRVRHLLEHTAGLENFRFHQIFSLHARADTPLAAALGADPMILRARPGAQYAYSNIGYHLLGMVVEAATGSRYETYLNTELLRPLGMNDSSAAFVTQAGPGADPKLAMGHFENGVGQASVPVYARPPVQFTTSAADMGRLAQFLMGDGRLAGQVFIAPALLDMLAGAHGTDAARAGLSTGHGLALATRDRNGAIGNCHPGTSVGFRAMLCLFPKERKAFFVAMNADVENADYERPNKLLTAALQLSRRAVHLAGEPAPTGMHDWEGIYVPAWNAVARLAWLDTVFNAGVLRWNGQLLQFQPMQGATASMHLVGGMLFRRSDRLAPSHVLFISNGERMFSDGLRTYRRASLTNMLWLWTSAALGVLGLTAILSRGLWLLVRGRLKRDSKLAVPLASVLLLFLPLPLFFTQSFLQLGDLTLASGLLAFATCALPLSMAYGLMRLTARPVETRRPVSDGIALLAVLQLTIVLAAWGMLPVVMWR